MKFTFYVLATAFVAVACSGSNSATSGGPETKGTGGAPATSSLATGGTQKTTSNGGSSGVSTTSGGSSPGYTATGGTFAGTCVAGTVGCACYPDDTCNAGAQCFLGTCLLASNSTGGASTFGGTTSAVANTGGTTIVNTSPITGGTMATGGMKATGGSLAAGGSQGTGGNAPVYPCEDLNKECQLGTTQCHYDYNIQSNCLSTASGGNDVSCKAFLTNYCGGNNPGTGGRSSTGGATNTGGTTSTAGAKATGGASSSTGGNAATGGNKTAGGASTTGGTASGTGGTISCQSGSVLTTTTVSSASWTISTAYGARQMCEQSTFSSPQQICVGQIVGVYVYQQFAGTCASRPPTTHPVDLVCAAPATDVATISNLQSWTLFIYSTASDLSQDQSPGTCAGWSDYIL